MHFSISQQPSSGAADPVSSLLNPRSRMVWQSDPQWVGCSLTKHDGSHSSQGKPAQTVPKQRTRDKKVIQIVFLCIRIIQCHHKFGDSATLKWRILSRNTRLLFCYYGGGFNSFCRVPVIWVVTGCLRQKAAALQPAVSQRMPTGFDKYPGVPIPAGKPDPG